MDGSMNDPDSNRTAHTKEGSVASLLEVMSPRTRVKRWPSRTKPLERNSGLKSNGSAEDFLPAQALPRMNPAPWRQADLRSVTVPQIPVA